MAPGFEPGVRGYPALIGRPPVPARSRKESVISVLFVVVLALLLLAAPLSLWAAALLGRSLRERADRAER